MRRQASRSIWPYLGLLICLLVMSLAAPHSWYVTKRDKPEQNASPPTPEVPVPVAVPPWTPSDASHSSAEQPDVLPRGEIPTADRLAALIDVIDDVSLASLLPVPPEVPSFLPQLDEWTRAWMGLRRIRGLPADGTQAEKAAAPPLRTTDAGPIEGYSETITSPAELGVDVSDVQVDSFRDRLAIRLRHRGQPSSPQHVTTLPNAPSTAIADATWLRVEPKSLLERLDGLAASSSPQLSAWAEAARGEVEQVYQSVSSNRDAIAASLDTLAQRIEAAKDLEPSLALEERNDLQLVRAALIRRLAVWNALLAVAGDRPDWQAAGDAFIRAAAETKTELEHEPQGGDWGEYLLLDAVTEKWEASPDRSDKHLRQLIEQLVDRFDNPRLTSAQRTMLTREPFASLRERFGDWAAATVDLTILCRAIEAQEAEGGEVYARRIAADAGLLAVASDPDTRRVAEVIDRYYRGANLRVAVTREFLQRLIPKQPTVLEPVRDVIGGAAIAGRSRTETDVEVLLIPDTACWRIGLEVTGNVASQTAITTGPATFHSSARTDYIARKLVVLTPVGLHSFPAIAGAAANNVLQGLETSFDGIPLIEGLVRSIVMSQHDANRRQVLAAVESRVSRTARDRLDTQLDRRLDEAAGQMRQTVWTPLLDLGLRPEELMLETTAERLTGACRVAADRQLAADTPRPYALADSVLSMQVHESVFNNLVEQLELSGRRFMLPELYAHIATQLGRDEVDVPDDLSTTACVQFARFDAIAVAIKNGRVRITLSIDAVQEGRNRYCDFRVHAYYRPQVQGLSAQLVRDGIIEIEGSLLRPAHHAVLQGVFVTLFSEGRPLTVIPADRNEDPRLAGLMITQLVLEEGWLGVAMGRSTRDGQP